MSAHRETSQSMLENIQEMAKKNFAEHEMKELLRLEQIATWRCAKPGTGVYGFWVTIQPGRIFQWGDVGGLVVQSIFGTVEETLKWLKGADRYYILNKVPMDHRKEEFFVGDALAGVKEHRQNGYITPKVAQKLSARLQGERSFGDPIETAEQFYAAYYELTKGSTEFPKVTGDAAFMAWGWEALAWWREQVFKKEESSCSSK